jgi:hypothetical protein
MATEAEDLAKVNAKIQDLLSKTELSQKPTVDKPRVSTRRQENKSSSLSEVIEEVNSDKELAKQIEILSQPTGELECCKLENVRAVLIKNLQEGKIPDGLKPFVEVLINSPERLQALIQSSTTEMLQKLQDTGDISILSHKFQKFASEEISNLVASQVNETPTVQIRQKVESNNSSTDSLTSQSIANHTTTDIESSSFKYQQPDLEIQKSPHFEISPQNTPRDNSFNLDSAGDSIQSTKYGADLSDNSSNLQTLTTKEQVTDLVNSPIKTNYGNSDLNSEINLRVEDEASNLKTNQIPLNSSTTTPNNVIDSEIKNTPRQPGITQIENQFKINVDIIQKADINPKTQTAKIDLKPTEKTTVLTRGADKRLDNISRLQSKLTQFVTSKEITVQLKKLVTTITNAVEANKIIKSELNANQRQTLIRNLQNELVTRLANIRNQNLIVQLAQRIATNEVSKLIKPELLKPVLEDINKRLKENLLIKDSIQVQRNAPREKLELNSQLRNQNLATTVQTRAPETVLRLSIVNNITARDITKLAQNLLNDKILLQKFPIETLRKLSEKLELIAKMIEDKDGKLSLKDKKLLNTTLKELQEVLGKDSDRILKALRNELALKNLKIQETIKVDKERINIQIQTLRTLDPKFQSLPLQLQNLIAMYLMQQLAEYRSAQDLYEMIKEINEQWAEMLKELDIERLLSAGVEFVSDETKSKKRKKIRTSRGMSIDIENSKFKNTNKGKAPSDGMTSGSKLAAQVETSKTAQKADTSGPSADLIIARTKSDSKKPDSAVE